MREAEYVRLKVDLSGEELRVGIIRRLHHDDQHDFVLDDDGQHIHFRADEVGEVAEITFHAGNAYTYKDKHLVTRNGKDIVYTLAMKGWVVHLWEEGKENIHWMQEMFTTKGIAELCYWLNLQQVFTDGQS